MLATRFSRRNATVINRQSPITENELRTLTPSVFADSAHESRSSRYTYIPTIEVLRGLMREGFMPFFAAQARSRIEGKENFTKHMLRLRHADDMARQARVNDSVNEVIIINSHDGASAYQMLAGRFRFVCTNGMCVADSTVGEVRVRHSGDVQTEVISGAHEIMRSFEAIDASVDGMRSMQLSSGEQKAFARAALALRYPTDEDETKLPPIAPEQVIEPRRWEERNDPSLWGTFNRAQENLVRGGLRTNDRRRRTHTRAVNGIDGNVALNRGLWVLAEEMRKLRVAAA